MRGAIPLLEACTGSGGEVTMSHRNMIPTTTPAEIIRANRSVSVLFQKWRAVGDFISVTQVNFGTTVS